MFHSILFVYIEKCLYNKNVSEGTLNHEINELEFYPTTKSMPSVCSKAGWSVILQLPTPTSLGHNSTYVHNLKLSSPPPSPHSPKENSR